MVTPTIISGGVIESADGGIRLPGYASAAMPIASLARTFVYKTDGMRGIWGDDGTYFYRQGGSLVSVEEFGANTAASASANKTAIQAAIDAVASAGRGTVTFSNYYSINGTLTITTSAVELLGIGVNSGVLYTPATGDVIQIGDNVTSINNVRISNLSIDSTTTTGIGINNRQAQNTVIDRCKININLGTAVFIGGGGGGSICNKVLYNVIAATTGINHSGNGHVFIGNRLDGQGNATGTAFVSNGHNYTVYGNTLETFAVGLDLQSGTAVDVTGNYFENFGTASIRANQSYVDGFNISNNRFVPSGLEQVSIDLAFMRGGSVKENSFYSAHLAGAPIRLNGGLNSDVEIGRNRFTDANEVILPTDFAKQYIKLESEEKYFQTKNLLENTFSVWPGGGSVAPMRWELVGGTVTQASDAPIGRYGIDLGASAQIETFIFPSISATLHSNIRGRYVVGGVWAKATAGSPSLQLVVSDDTAHSETRTLTSSWAFYPFGIKVSATATTLSFALVASATGSIRIADPVFYIGTTYPRGASDREIYAFVPDIDGTTYTASVAGIETDLKSISIPADTMADTGRIRIFAAGSVTGTAGTKDIKLYMGGTVIATIAKTAGQTDDWAFEAEILFVGTSAQRIYIKAFDGNVLETTTGYATRTINVQTTAFAIKTTGQTGGIGDTITQTMWIVEPINL